MHSVMSRELTIAWAKRNRPDPRVVKDVASRLGDAAGSGHLLLLFGKGLAPRLHPFFGGVVPAERWPDAERMEATGTDAASLVPVLVTNYCQFKYE